MQIYMKLRKGFLGFLFLVLAGEPFYPSLSVRQGWVGCIRPQMAPLPWANPIDMNLYPLHRLSLKGVVGLVEGMWVIRGSYRQT